MNFEIEVSNQAETDLRGIYEYIAFELQAHENASEEIHKDVNWNLRRNYGIK